MSSMTDSLKRGAGLALMMGSRIINHPVTRPSGESRESRSLSRASSGQLTIRMYSLRVIQQPERARLCSYKEENETSESPLAVMTRW
jgi:hypothetical protein